MTASPFTIMRYGAGTSVLQQTVARSPGDPAPRFSQPPTGTSPATGRKRSDAPPSPPHPIHVLLVEDVPVNRLVAVRELKRLGLKVATAENGREAVRLHETGRFDALLMDVQMPVLDGLQATRAIRARERETGGHVPIIAMTASADEADRGRCLAAGMDDCLPKPIDGRRTLATLRRWLDHPARRPHDPPLVSAPVADRALAARVLERHGGDGAFVRELVGIFAADAGRLLAELRWALDRDDLAAARETAHRLNGAAANLGLAELAGTLAELERRSRDGNREAAATLARRAAAESESALAALRRADPEDTP